MGSALPVVATGDLGHWHAGLKALPSEFANYSIEWEKTRLKKYIKKLDKDADSEKNAEYFFSFTEKLPAKMVKEAIGAVGIDWLEKTGK